MATQLSVVLRPKRLQDVIGQPGAVAYVRGMIKKRSAPNLLLLAGPSGGGKTSVARLIGSILTGWRGDPDRDPNQRDVPANVERTIENVRELIEFGKYRPNGGARRVIVVDEAHSYAGPAASALLKATEDPPPHLTWIFCTDQPGKLNATLRSRAQTVSFRALGDADLTTIVERTLKHVDLRLHDRAFDAVTRRIVATSYGSARTAVQLVETLDTAVAGGASVREALDQAIENNPTIASFDVALAWLGHVLSGDAAMAVRSLGSESGDGVLEIAVGMLSGLVRKAAGGTPRDGLGWVAVKRIRCKADLHDMLKLETAICAGMHARIASNYQIPADALLFALSKTCVREARS